MRTSRVLLYRFRLACSNLRQEKGREIVYFCFKIKLIQNSLSGHKMACTTEQRVI